MSKYHCCYWLSTTRIELPALEPSSSVQSLGWQQQRPKGPLIARSRILQKQNAREPRTCRSHKPRKCRLALMKFLVLEDPIMFHQNRLLQTSVCVLNILYTIACDHTAFISKSPVTNQTIRLVTHRPVIGIIPATFRWISFPSFCNDGL